MKRKWKPAAIEDEHDEEPDVESDVEPDLEPTSVEAPVEPAVGLMTSAYLVAAALQQAALQSQLAAAQLASGPAQQAPASGQGYLNTLASVNSQQQNLEQIFAVAMAASALLSSSATNHLVPEDLTMNQVAASQHQQQQVAAAMAAVANPASHLYGSAGQAPSQGGRANGLDATSFQQANNFNKQLVAAVQSHLASQQQQQAQQQHQDQEHQLQTQTQHGSQAQQQQHQQPHQHSHQHTRQSQLGAAHSLIAHQRADRHLSGSLLAAAAGVQNGAAHNGPAGSANSPTEWHLHHATGAASQGANSDQANHSNTSQQHPYHRAHPHHLLGGHHHHSSIQTQQQLLATKGYNPMAVLAGSGQQTEILTPTHLKKAKLMFFYLRYPNSSTLKECFRDVRFGKNNMAQLVKWFSNFREFYYIQMEKFAREAVADERIQCKEDIVVDYNHELINVLNNHYNKNRHIELPEVFRQVVQETLRHFFEAIHQKRDQEQSWKKAIYKSIARLDMEVPEEFKTELFNQSLE